jgi:hypothetical protein
MDHTSDLIHRVNPQTSIGWFIIGLLIKHNYDPIENKSSDDSDSDNSEVLTPDAPRMRRNATSFGSFSSTV